MHPRALRAHHQNRMKREETLAALNLVRNQQQMTRKLPAMGDLRALQGVSKFPVRIKCALLGFDALRTALETEPQH